MALREIVVVCSVVLLESAVAQGQPCDIVNPDISQASLDVAVSPTPEGYRYEYTIVNPATNTGCPQQIRVSVLRSTATPSDQIVVGSGPIMKGRDGMLKGPGEPLRYTVPGTYSIFPISLPGCSGSVGAGSFSFDCSWIIEADREVPGPRVERGQSFTVASIVSAFPPAPREYSMLPLWDPFDPATTLVPADDTGIEWFANVIHRGVTLGPTDPAEITFYNGGGQSPADVNPFLTYTNPVAHRTPVRAADARFPLAIRYGPTTVASTFRAVLNGADVTSSFHPLPGRIEAVTLPLAAGSNTIVLSIDGRTASGRTATDTDRLVFLVGP